MSLAAKLPWTHRFAGGFSGIGSQPLPTDADAIDYLSRMAAADGAGVETGVAVAVDAFFKGTKADGTFSALKAACILCGARTLSGALVPLVGTAPTNVANNFVSSDYSRTTGLKGDGSTKYLDSNRANNADGQNDNHNAIYLFALETDGGTVEMGAAGAAGRNMINVLGTVVTRCRDATAIDTGITSAASGLVAFSRSDSSGYDVRAYGDNFTATAPSDGHASENVFVFANNTAGSAVAISSARIAFYSIGTSLDLGALDNRVSTLVSQIAVAI